LKIKKAIRNKKGIVWTLSNISSVYSDMGEYDKAIKFYLQSLDIAIEIGLVNQILHSYDDLSELFSVKGDFENAYKYSRLYVGLKDSVFNENKVKIIEEIQTKYETEKKENENDILKKDVKHRKKVQLLLFIIISGLFIIAISLFFLFRIKNKSLRKSKLLYRQQQKLTKLELKNKEMEKQRLEELIYAEQKINNLQQDKIKNKNRELSTVTLHILNKNKILSEIKNEIGNMCKDNENDISQFRRITNLIDGNIVLDQDWEQFKKHFEEVHKGFFQKLITNFPELTNNDLRLCAYLKINLSTKEVARLLNVTTAAIKKSRQRLRKKLRLESEEDLTSYLNKL
jgi:tetratricopeptide (TPR) repeat protein